MFYSRRQRKYRQAVEDLYTKVGVSRHKCGCCGTTYYVKEEAGTIRCPACGSPDIEDPNRIVRQVYVNCGTFHEEKRFLFFMIRSKQCTQLG